MINQVELHPYLQQKQLRQFCNAKGIIVESWSPLARARVTEDNVLQEVGRKYGKTEAQITIRWHIQSGLVVIPKSAHKERIQENFNVFDFELDQADMQALNNLDENMRTGVDPESFS
ncbi:MAG: aldo/keto reductase [Spirochaetia bacterium]